jgi:hypothetical protein
VRHACGGEGLAVTARFFASAIASGIALLSTGCTSLDRETSFDGSEPGGAMAVVVADGMATGLATSDTYLFEAAVLVHDR